MRLSELQSGQSFYTQLAHDVLAVLSIREDGWCVYIGAVAGEFHDEEWPQVLKHGAKAKVELAATIATTYFHPRFVIDLPYAY